MSRVAWYLSFVLCGASLGWGLVTARARLEQRAGPPGWTLRTARIPAFAAVDQPLAEGGGWPLLDHAELRGPVGAGGRVLAEVRVPAGGTLEVGLDVGGGLAGVHFSRQTQPATRPFTRPPRGQGAWLVCERPLPPPGDGPVSVEVRAGGEALIVNVDGVNTACTAQVLVPRASVLRGGLLRALVLSVNGEAAPGAGVSWRVAGALLGAALFGLLARLVGRSKAADGNAGEAGGAGRTLDEHEGLSRDVGRADGGRGTAGEGPPGDAGGGDGTPGGNEGPAGDDRRAGWSWGENKPLSGHARWLGVAVLPLLAVAPLVSLDARGTLEALRVQAREPTLWLLGAPIAAALGLGAVGVVWRLRSAFGLVIGAATGAGIAAAAGPESPAAIGAAAAVGALVAGVVWVNAARPRGFNVVSILLLCAAAAIAEGGLRVTATGRSLASVPSREEASLRSEHWALTETREYTTYPSQGYPVEPPARTAPVRVVAFGGSSTGGAFSSDNLDTFWPAILGQKLGPGAGARSEATEPGARSPEPGALLSPVGGSATPDVQVVNQGVGGWTTLHIRRYIETNLDRVDPDVAVFYVGHNDRFTPSAVPYATLFGSWEQRPAASLSRALSELRLYQGLRFGLAFFAGRPAGQAVPLEHMRDNLAAIVTRLRERGARVLFMREAVAVGGDLLYEHARALCVFEAEDVGCLDVASALEDPLAGQMFLDNVHLNPQGHATLAALVATELERRGWLR